MAASLAQPPHKTWTRAELEALKTTGFLADTRFELIEGEIFDKMGQNPPHASAVCRLVMALAAIFGLNRVRTQLPVEPAEAEAPISLPEPDVAVAREDEAAYRRRHPGAADTLLIAEITDSTYDYDVKRKARLYARAGFSEYIVLDLNARELLVFRTPLRGIYKNIEVLRPGDVFRPLVAPDSAIAVADVLAE